jgi:nucleoside phosphorylase
VLKDNVRVVVLNACYSQAQAKAIVREIDCAVGMNDAILDDAAIAFAAEFYQALGFGKSVQEAFDIGVARLMGEGVARGLAKLHKRRGVKPADIVLVGSGPVPGPAAISQPASEGQSMSQANEGMPAPTVGIITALPEEFDAVRIMLADTQRHRTQGPGAGHEYLLGEVVSPRGGVHRVVLAQTAVMGNNSAALRASKLLTDFHTVDAIIMCGIAGGVPNPESPTDHVRLGDIVVSDRLGVVQYDFGKQKGKKFEPRHSPRPPSSTLLQAVQVLEQDRLAGQRPWDEFLKLGLQQRSLSRPDDAADVLLDRGGAPVTHPAYAGPRPRVFLGPIASSNVVQGDAARRDALRDQFKVKAVEMEGSGIADATWEYEKAGYLVVRGVCDYYDARNKGQKTDLWKPYAAMAAAAYVRALLEAMPGAVPAHPQ